MKTFPAMQTRVSHLKLTFPATDVVLHEAHDMSEVPDHALHRRLPIVISELTYTERQEALIETAFGLRGINGPTA